MEGYQLPGGRFAYTNWESLSWFGNGMGAKAVMWKMKKLREIWKLKVKVKVRASEFSNQERQGQGQGRGEEGLIG